MKGTFRALAGIRGGLVVSCQAPRDSHLGQPRVIAAIVASVLEAGAAGVRVEGPTDIRSAKRLTDKPVIGLIKGEPGPLPYITASLSDAAAVVNSGADIVAVDGTRRGRPDNSSLGEAVDLVHAGGALVMADVACLQDGESAFTQGADIVATTLSGYVPAVAGLQGPDLNLVGELVGLGMGPVVAEGRYATPDQVLRAQEMGAWAVVVGSAITRPDLITRRFAERG